LVFPRQDGTKWTLNEKVFDNLMEESGTGKTERKLNWYFCRNFYRTKRIEEGVDVNLLAEQLGTSVRMIESH
jgi:hypothetical protein